MSEQTAQQSVDALVHMLDVQPDGQDLFKGISPDASWQRVYGGQVIAQAQMAACKTVAAPYAPHSLHGTFLRPGDPEQPIIYAVERTRDGQAFARRRVVASQGKQSIFEAMVSFQVHESAVFEHQAAMPDVLSPEAVKANGDPQAGFFKVAPPAIARYWQSQRPLDLRPVSLKRYTTGEPQPPVQHMWVRTRAVLPEPFTNDMRMHAAVLSYACDMTLLDTALLPHGRSVFADSIQAASLDHAIWLHAPARANEWLLYTQETPFAGQARGFARGAFFTRTGRLVASTTQEGLIRKAPTMRVPAGRG
jgi:acyl-CoA thioesterase-2